MLVSNAEVILKWSDGKVTKIGTIEMTADKNGMLQAKVKHIFQKAGLGTRQERVYADVLRQEMEGGIT